MVERLVHVTPNQEVAGAKPDGDLNFSVSESAFSTAQAGKVIVTSAHPPGGM